MTRRRTATAADIEALRLRFERWRRTRKSKTRIPDGLWSAAVELARRYGINRTAAPLRLDGGKLKRLPGGRPWFPEVCTAEVRGVAGTARSAHRLERGRVHFGVGRPQS
jgi:hypothetical protein